MKRRNFTAVSKCAPALCGNGLIYIAHETDPQALQQLIAQHGSNGVMDLAQRLRLLGQMLGWSHMYKEFLPDLSEYGWLQCALADIAMILADSMQDLGIVPVEGEDSDLEG